VLTIHQSECSNLASARGKEWLLTNGLGGYSSSTITGMNTRRYHGLLVAATTPPVGRTVLLSKLEETLVVDGERLDLSTNLYGGDTVHPHGYQYLHEFSLDPFPVFTFASPHFTITKSIFMVQGESTIVVEYVLAPGSDAHEISLEVRPLIAFRDYHSTTHENGAINGYVEQRPGSVKLKPYSDLPGLFIAHDADTVIPEGNWYRHFEYEIERERGLDFVEDLFSPLVFATSLTRHTRLTLIASTEEHAAADAANYRRAETARQEPAHVEQQGKRASSELIPILTKAAEQFIVARPPLKTIMAGYPWFGDWGRDTMISLPGLLLSTDQPEAARDILLQFLKFVDGGMLPNRFPDHGEAPEYNTVDGTLWFFDAIRHYVDYRSDQAWKDEAYKLVEMSFYPALKDIVKLHLSGTRYGIKADGHGFLWAGDDSTQLTWMDAKIGDTAFTPRSGRAVEIQALWYNALRILEEFDRHFGDTVAANDHAEIADSLQNNFERVFWNEAGGYLYDVVGHSGGDTSIRPNQVIAISLRHCLLGQQRALQVLAVAERELLTPFGLRTLSPSDHQYRGVYEGNSWSRDSAYHQGTMWPWLAGPFFIAKLRFAEDQRKAVEETETWLAGFSRHLREAGLGQISEIFDGDAPWRPRGCFAQAWSVSELLKVAKLVDKLSK
jgi:predicted glycogen debranching enzyme